MFLVLCNFDCLLKSTNNTLPLPGTTHTRIWWALTLQLGYYNASNNYVDTVLQNTSKNADKQKNTHTQKTQTNAMPIVQVHGWEGQFFTHKWALEKKSFFCRAPLLWSVFVDLFVEVFLIMFCILSFWCKHIEFLNQKMFLFGDNERDRNYIDFGLFYMSNMSNSTTFIFYEHRTPNISM